MQQPVWFDRLVGSDPGLIRLRTALQAVVTIGVAMLVEREFVSLTHALQIPSAGLPAATVSLQHHGVLVIAIMIGAVIGLISAFAGGLFDTTRQELRAFVAMPFLMSAGLFVGLAAGPYRVTSLAALVVVLAAGAYCRRFGPIGFIGGQVVFMGTFFGFFLHAEFALHDIGWLALEIGLGAVVAIGARYLVFSPNRRKALRRMRRSYLARARGVAAAALEVLADPGAAAGSRRLHRRIGRLNEAALMIDVQLSDPGAIPEGWSAAALHQSLFDAELSLANMARFAEAVSRFDLEPRVTGLVRAALTAVGQGAPLQAELAARDLMSTPVGAREQVLVHRFAVSVLGFVEAGNNWRAAATAGTTDFTSSVTLAGGWLPGSSLVSAAASQEPGPGRGGPWYRARLWDRVVLAPNVRVAIQMGVAVTAAILLGDALSGRRFYWAVIAAFVTFMGANNTGEQVRKGLLRIAGTVVGALVGATLAHLVGQRTNLAIAVILVALFLGLYLMRISYAFMVVGVTIMVSQLYVQLDEFSNSLLVLRLEETALGAGVAALTVVCVLPLRTGRVAGVAARHLVQAIEVLVGQAVATLQDPAAATDLRAAARDVDAAHQSLVRTLAALRTPFGNGGDTPREQFLQAATAARNYARNLLVDTVGVQVGGADLEPAHRCFATSLGELQAALLEPVGGRCDRVYVRSASLFAEPGDALTPRQLALRDLQLLDGALARLATSLGMRVQALDEDLVGISTGARGLQSS